VGPEFEAWRGAFADELWREVNHSDANHAEFTKAITTGQAHLAQRPGLKVPTQSVPGVEFGPAYQPRA